MSARIYFGIGPFTRVHQILAVRSPVRAAKAGDDIVAISMDWVEDRIVNRLVAPCGVYDLPDVCHILVADKNVYAAGKNRVCYTFVLPPGVTKSVFGARGVYEKEGYVWYKSAPEAEAIKLFPAPLLFLECRNGITIAASHYNFSVISGKNVFCGEVNLPISSVGISEDRWYITKVAGREEVIVQTQEGEIARVPRVNAIVVGDIIVGYGVQDTMIIPGSDTTKGIPVHPVRALDDSFLVVGQDCVIELARR